MLLVINMKSRAKKGHDEPSIPSTNVFINYLPFWCMKPQLVELCQQFGRIVSAKVMIDLCTGHSRGFGFVRFATIGSAQLAVTYLNGLSYGGKRLVARFASSKENIGTPSNTLHIKSLPLDLTENELYLMVSPFGEICGMKMDIEKRTGKFNGSAHITFSDSYEARAALDHLNNLKVRPDCWPLFIRFSPEAVPTSPNPFSLRFGISIEKRSGGSIGSSSQSSNSGNESSRSSCEEDMESEVLDHFIPQYPVDDFYFSMLAEMV